MTILLLDSGPEPSDIAFRDWFNREQPLFQIQLGGKAFTSWEQTKQVQAWLKKAFAMGYASGVAAEAARALLDHPELGPVR
jgi:hypothetical protein